MPKTQNRLIRIYIDDNLPGGYNTGDTIIADYTYDALGRRIQMIAYDNSGQTQASTTTRYYYDGQRVLLETDYAAAAGTETDQRYFVYGNYIDEVLLMADVDSNNGITDGDYTYAHDHLYSVAALFNAAGAVVERYEYDAYGKANILSSAFSVLSSSQYANPYTFTGRRLDTLDPDAAAQSRLNLMYYRARTYDPQTGRFMQRDMLEYVDGMSLYEYVSSSPILFSDPTGLVKLNDCYSTAIRYEYSSTDTTTGSLLKKIGIDQIKFKLFGKYKECNVCCNGSGGTDQKITIGGSLIFQAGSIEKDFKSRWRLGWYGRLSIAGEEIRAHYNPCTNIYDGGGCMTIGGELGGIAEGGAKTRWVTASVGGRVGVNAKTTVCIIPKDEGGWDITAKFCAGVKGRIWAKGRIGKRKPWAWIIWEHELGGCTDSKMMGSFGN